MANFLATPIQEFVFYDKYSRWNDKLGRRETWEETVKRVMAYLKELSNGKLSRKTYAEIEKLILSGEVAPSMRLMRAAGDAARRNQVSLYNCAYTPIESIEAMAELLFISMSGVGAGFSVEKRYVDMLPAVKRQESNEPAFFAIPDTTEGWVEAFLFGLNTWFNGEDVVFDYSLIRPAGAILKTKGGTASGPAVLEKLLDFTRNLILSRQATRLQPIDVFNIVTMLAECAVSGGSRRSALLCMFDLDDKDMLYAKAGDFWQDPNKVHRANANISVVIENELGKDEFARIINAMFDNKTGEPGIVSRRAMNLTKPERRRKMNHGGVNACLAPGTMVRTKNGDFPIESLVGKEVEVWDGYEWIRIDNFRQTRENAETVHVSLSNGASITCTPDHRFILADGASIFANDLTWGKLLKTTNISEESIYVTELKIGSVIPATYCCTVPTTHQFALSCGIDIGQCSEIGLHGATIDNRFGGQFCNLSTVHVRENDTLESLSEKVRAATIIGTIQATATDFSPLMRPTWKEICDEERILGVSLVGYVDSVVARRSGNLVKLKELAVETNKVFAQKLGINQAAVITTIKPAGNSSVMYATARGINARYAPYYIRRVRVNRYTPVWDVLHNSGIPMEPVIGSDSTWVATFYEKSPDDAITVSQLTAIQQLEHWKNAKTNWAEHNVSVTIEYEEKERQQIINWLFKNQDIVNGVAFLPRTDHVYPQAPYEEVTQEEYEAAIATYPTIDWSLLQEYEVEDRTTRTVECSAGFCELV